MAKRIFFGKETKFSMEHGGLCPFAAKRTKTAGIAISRTFKTLLSGLRNILT